MLKIKRLEVSVDPDEMANYNRLMIIWIYSVCKYSCCCVQSLKGYLP